MKTNNWPFVTWMQISDRISKHNKTKEQPDFQQLFADFRQTKEALYEELSSFVANENDAATPPKTLNHLMAIKQKFEHKFIPEKAKEKDAAYCQHDLAFYHLITHLLFEIKENFEEFINDKYLPAYCFINVPPYLSQALSSTTLQTLKSNACSTFKPTLPITERLQTISKTLTSNPLNKELTPLLDALKKAIDTRQIKWSNEENHVLELLAILISYQHQAPNNLFMQTNAFVRNMVETTFIPNHVLDTFFQEIKHHPAIEEDTGFMENLRKELELLSLSPKTYTSKNTPNKKTAKKKMAYLINRAKHFHRSHSTSSTNTSHPQLSYTSSPKDFIESLANIIQNGRLRPMGTPSIKGVYEIICQFIHIKKEKGEGAISAASLHTYHKTFIEEQHEKNRMVFKTKHVSEN